MPVRGSPNAGPGASGAVETGAWPRGGHLVSIRQVGMDQAEDLFALADRMGAAGGPGERPAEGRIMATLFYEPSTRTRLSFESAMLRLGGDVVSTENAAQMSSAAKGESLRDTVRIVSGYADVIVLRHYEAGAAQTAAEVATVPVLNGGDGPGEHPTQALLDAYTIRRELGRLSGISLVFVGDMAYGRTAHSLALLATTYPDVRVTFVAPPQARTPEWLLAELEARGVAAAETEDLTAAARRADVLYMTRVQKERFANAEEYALARGAYRLDRGVLEALPERAVIMHPLPRLEELPEQVDQDPRAVYFAQARNGVPVRMAVLARALSVF